MHPNAKLIETFYRSFQQGDASSMAACYHDEVTFSDPVFPDLRGARAGGMWRMLCSRAKDLEISFSGVEADEQRGKAAWEAHYTFGKTGRHVHNRIEATFVFRDGKIVQHSDHFDFWRWSRMALGPIGLLLGWSPIVRGKVRRQSAGLLDQFLAKSNNG